MKIQEIHSIFINSKGVTTDSRKIEKGQIFFALKGENFNGNEYAKSAIERGAEYAIIDEAEYADIERTILVKGVLNCLQELAKFHRKYLNIPILAITGSNGKTTTKELISSVLNKRFSLGYTQGNLNNHIGVPLTLLSFSKETEMGVVEMGANHIGEIEVLCNIADPDYGIITNIGKAHIEGFGSFEGVIKTKSELYNYLKRKKGKIFINGEDNLLLSQSTDLEKVSYGKKHNLFVSAEFIASSPFLEIKWDQFEIRTKLVGEYNFNNVLAAICIGSYFNVPKEKIVEAIEDYQPKNNRSQLTKTETNTLIIDAYNANPTSMELAIRNFLNIKEDNKFLILGDMFELGGSSKEEHHKIIQLADKLKFENAIFIGENFYNFRNEFPVYQFFENTTSLSNYLKINTIKNATLLLKASRGIKLEQVVDYL
jgi:UDP-N-acetylmuramoyl-tripeptide--D-alanyl-D-alanine ligase